MTYIGPLNLVFSWKPFFPQDVLSLFHLANTDIEQVNIYNQSSFFVYSTGYQSLHSSLLRDSVKGNFISWL